MTDKPLTIGLFGYGSFGKFLAWHLRRYFPVVIYHPHASRTEKLPPRCRSGSVAEVGSCPIVIVAVNLPKFESLLKQIKPFIQPGALVCDVMSVKVKPVQLMQRCLPAHAQILATHPLFGPQSVGKRRKDLKDQKIVIYPVRVTNVRPIKKFLSQTLGLAVLELNPQTHDKQMALIHGLTFFLARGLMELKLPAGELTTPSYQKLLALAELERHHSPELFQTIEAGNPYAATIRQKLIRALERLNKQTH